MKTGRTRSRCTKGYLEFKRYGYVFLRHKTKLADIGFFRDFVDSHSHILPGVDDGIRTIEESLAVLAYFDSLGVKKVRLTPHVMNGVEHWEDVLQAFDTLRKRYTGETVLELGAEYMLDSGFRERLGKGLQPLCGDCVLVETSYFLHQTIWTSCCTMYRLPDIRR